MLYLDTRGRANPAKWLGGNNKRGNAVMGIKLKLTGLRRFVRTEAEIADYTAQVAAAQDTLVNGTGAGNDFLGWLNLPVVNSSPNSSVFAA